MVLPGYAECTKISHKVWDKDGVCMNSHRVQGQRWGLLLSGMCELVAKGTGKPEVLVSLVPQSSLVRFHRPLFLMKEFKKDIEPHQGTRTMPGNTWENLTCASQWDKTGCIQDC